MPPWPSAVILSAASLLLSLAGAAMLDRLAMPRRAVSGRPTAALAWVAGVAGTVWLLAFGATGRAGFALATVLVAVGIAVAISNVKRRTLNEPLVFSDFALLEHAVRHPQLFYIPRRWFGAVAMAFAAVLACIAAWMLLEPRTVSAPIQGAMLALAALAIAAASCYPPTLRMAARLACQSEPDGDVARLGLLATLTAHTAAWRIAPAPAQPHAMPVLANALSFDAVIIVQAESFVDLRRLGRTGIRLPAFDRLRQRAIATGLLEVPSEGAYTLRPESAVITGIGYEAQGIDRFHPYLRPERIAATALPRLLSQAGWDTLFVHPHDGAFFRRRHAMPVLGFARFEDETAFAGAHREGPFVSDAAVAQHLIEAVQESRAQGSRVQARPLFAYAVTMEAHDPYGPGRMPDENDPVRQYIRHIENADRMLARLSDEWDDMDVRVLLVFFGDHVPYLPELGDPLADTRTDFFVTELGRRAKNDRTSRRVERPEHLHGLLLDILGGIRDRSD